MFSYSLAECTAATEVEAGHYDASLSTQLCSPVAVSILHPAPECCARSQVRSANRHQLVPRCNSRLGHRVYSLQIANLKYYCLQTRFSVHTAIIFFVDALYKSTFTYLFTYLVTYLLQNFIRN